MAATQGLFRNRILLSALAASLGVHLAILAVRFVDPELFEQVTAAPPLEVILVNARSAKRPPAPQARAQANLDGGGANEQGRRTSPLPDSAQTVDGDALETARRSVARLEQEQRDYLPRPPLPEVNRARGLVSYEFNSIADRNTGMSTTQNGVVLRADVSLCGAHPALMILCGTGFSLWGLVLARAKIHRLKPALLVPPAYFFPFVTSFCTRQLFMSAMNSKSSDGQAMPCAQFNWPSSWPDSPHLPSIFPSGN